MSARLRRLYRSSPPQNVSLNLTSYWRLEEASGNRADSKGSNTLTASGTPGNIAAVQGSGCTMNGTTDFLFCASSASLVFTGAGNGFTIGAWVWPAAINATKAIIQKQDTSTTIEYKLIMQSNGSFGFGISSDGTTQTNALYGASTIPAASGWYLVLGGYDPIAKVIFCQFADASGSWRAPVTTAFSAGGFNGTSKLCIGKDIPNARFWNGRIDEVFIYSRALRDRERNYLLASGAGRPYGSNGLYS